MIFNITHAKKHFLCKMHLKTQKHNISYNIKSKRANLVKHTFHRLLGKSIVTVLLRLSCLPTANLGVCFPFTSLCVVFCRAASTSPCRLYDMPPHSLFSQQSTASCLQTPPLPLASCLPAGCHVTPVVAPPPPLVLFSMLPPPLVLLTRSLPRDEQPPPRDTPPPIVSWHLSSCLPLF